MEFHGLNPRPNYGQVLKGFAMFVTKRGFMIMMNHLNCLMYTSKLYDESPQLLDVHIQVVPTLLTYNIRTNQWFISAALGVPRYYLACTVCDNIKSTWQGKSMLATSTLWVSGNRFSEVYAKKAKRLVLVAIYWMCDLMILRHCLNTWKGHVETYGGKLWSEVDGSNKQAFSTMETNCEHWPPNQRLYLTMASQLFLLHGVKVEICFSLLVGPNATTSPTLNVATFANTTTKGMSLTKSPYGPSVMWAQVMDYGLHLLSVVGVNTNSRSPHMEALYI
ncbi:hypothetical protein CR513_60179, partial [Mucuna pruriens]